MEVFTESNISPEIGMEIMNALSINGLDIQDPSVYKKYRDIALYAGRFEDGPAIIRKISRGAKSGEEKISKVSEYIGLRKSLTEVRDRIGELPPVDAIINETEEHRELNARESQIINEIRYYEK